MSKQVLPEPGELKEHKCVPCEGEVEPLTREEFGVYLPQVPGWEVVDSDKKIEKEFEFPGFLEAIEFFNKVADVAETEGHHPNMCIHDYKKVSVSLTTFAINGLSVNDFVVAVKIEGLD